MDRLPDPGPAQRDPGSAHPPAGSRCPGSLAGPGEAVDVLADQLVQFRRAVETLRTRVLEHSPHGLEGAPLVALHHLVVHGSSRPSALAERMGLDQSTASRHIATLARRGYVERLCDPADRRAALVRLTPDGRRVHDDTRRLRRRVLAEALADWDAAELAGLTRGLARLTDDLEARTSDTVVAALAATERDRAADERGGSARRDPSEHEETE